MPSNVFGNPLKICCQSPMTGFYRDGFCKTDSEDLGTHILCAVMTDDFLQFSKSKGNDLITARPEYRFPGLKAGDCWCLCITRWKEAYQAGVAPLVNLEATHELALAYVPLNILQKYAVN